MDNNILIPIGKRISEIRRANNVTQEHLAELLNVTPKHISHTECGKSCLSIKALMEFCCIFDCSLDYIIFGQTQNKILSKLPTDIIDILLTGNETEIERLNRYLHIYAELLQKQD